jgi:hypothetical protein
MEQGTHFEKLIVAQLVMKFHAFCGAQSLRYFFHKGPPLSQLNPVHTPINSFEIQFIINL